MVRDFGKSESARRIGEEQTQDQPGGCLSVVTVLARKDRMVEPGVALGSEPGLVGEVVR